MLKDGILEFPYHGVITRIKAGKGMQQEEERLVIYEGVMDEHMVTDENGNFMQTALYIISIPLTQDEDGNWIVPRKGDKVSVTRYGETFELTVNNATPSQLMGVSIYATRNSW
jgi:hypothetical protein